MNYVTQTLACGLAKWVVFLHMGVTATVAMHRVRNPIHWMIVALFQGRMAA